MHVRRVLERRALGASSPSARTGSPLACPALALYPPRRGQGKAYPPGTWLAADAGSAGSRRASAQGVTALKRSAASASAARAGGGSEPPWAGVDATLHALDDAMKMLSSAARAPVSVRGPSRAHRPGGAPLGGRARGARLESSRAAARRSSATSRSSGGCSTCCSATGPGRAGRHDPARGRRGRRQRRPRPRQLGDRRDRARLARADGHPLRRALGARREHRGALAPRRGPRRAGRRRERCARSSARRASKGEAYARELATAWTAATGIVGAIELPAACRSPPANGTRPIARLAGGDRLDAPGDPLARRSRARRARRARAPRSSPDLEPRLAPEDDRLESMRRRLSLVRDFVAELAAVGEIDPSSRSARSTSPRWCAPSAGARRPCGAGRRRARGAHGPDEPPPRARRGCLRGRRQSSLASSSAQAISASPRGSGGRGDRARAGTAGSGRGSSSTTRRRRCRRRPAGRSSRWRSSRAPTDARTASPSSSPARWRRRKGRCSSWGTRRGWNGRRPSCTVALLGVRWSAAAPSPTGNRGLPRF